MFAKRYMYERKTYQTGKTKFNENTNEIKKRT